MTAASLLATLTPHGIEVVDDELTVGNAPDALLYPLTVLHTGVRALIRKTRWYGSTVADGVRAQVVELDPAVLIPPRILLLCCEGDARWDRLSADVRIDMPALFAVPKEKPVRVKPKRTTHT